MIFPNLVDVLKSIKYFESPFELLVIIDSLCSFSNLELGVQIVSILLDRPSTALCLWLADKCEYLSVICRDLCPSNSLTVFKSTPLMTKCEAKVCLRS